MSFNAESRKISQLFGRILYQIPRNQRQYVWNKPNWQELYEDIEYVVNRQFPSHFIGSIVLIDAGTDTGIPLYTIIDGQQRIMTLTIFLTCVAFWMKKRRMYDDFEGTKPYIIAKDNKAQDRVMVTAENHHSLESIIQRLINADLEEETRSSLSLIDDGARNPKYDKNVISAFKFFMLKIKDMYEKTEDKNKTDEYLIELRDAIIGIQYVSIVADSEEDAYTIFEILNARGLDLEEHELLKNYIMRYIQPQSSRDEAKEIWMEIEKTVGNSTNMAKFIQHYAIHKYGHQKGESYYKIIQQANRGKNTKKLLDDLKRKANYYKLLISPKVKEEKNQYNDVEYIVFSFLKRKRQIHIRPLILSLIHKNRTENIKFSDYEKCLLFLYDFYVCYNIIGGANSNKLSGTINKYARELENDFSYEKLNETISELRKKIPNKETFVNSFRNIGWTHHGGFFEGSTNKERVQTTLEVLERHMQTNGSFHADFTIEHVLPDNYSEANALIGNLIPLEDRLNQRCNQILYDPDNVKGYLKKKFEIYKESNFITARNLADRYYTNPEKFDPNQRTSYMANQFFSEILKFSIPFN